ncbi:hypothetical protein [Ruegeria sp. Ofav3-42]|uniref:hypothetical protein n=1 Tax=Ruegeria sp. Ofav3-42 TaxID=2917759 RepID=UPI001EF5A4D3|nr:hypothetical protein [Ruegeria sp. Ofav3-42]MCG7521232.1 hypothetical protein [Ruegeria sp. Ofav3-42]
MISLKRRLYRERRRFIVIALMTFIAGLVAGMNDDRIVFGIPFQLAYGAAFLLLLTPVLMAIALFFPAVRMATESVAFSLPIICIYLAIGKTDSSFSEFFFIVVAIMFCQLTFSVYGGGWLDRFLPSRKRTFQSKVRTRLTPEEVWPFLVVTPDTVDTYGDENTVSIEWRKPGVSFVEVSQIDDLTRVEELQVIEQFEPNAQFRVRFEALSAKKGTNGSSGTLERTFQKISFGTALQTTRSFDYMSPTASFRMWLDDGFARFDDKYVARAEQMSGL